MRDIFKCASGIGLTLPPPPRDASKESKPPTTSRGYANIYAVGRGITFHTPQEDTKPSWHGPSRSFWEKRGKAAEANGLAARVPATNTCRPAEGETPPAREEATEVAATIEEERGGE